MSLAQYDLRLSIYRLMLGIEPERQWGDCIALMPGSGGASGAEESKAAAITLEVKLGVEKQLRGMLCRASRSHGTKLAAPAGIVANYLVSTMRGLSQLAIDGASKREMLRVGDLAARACVL